MKKLCKRMLALIVALVLMAGTFHTIPAFGNELTYDGYVVADAYVNCLIFATHNIDYSQPAAQSTATAPSVAVPPPVMISVPPAFAGQGQYVDVEVRLGLNVTGLSSLGLMVAYDSNILQAISITLGIMIIPPSTFTPGQNPIRLDLYAGLPSENTTRTGNLVTIRFRVCDYAPAGPTPVTVTIPYAYRAVGYYFECVRSAVGVYPRNGVVNVCPPYRYCAHCAPECPYDCTCPIFKYREWREWQRVVGQIMQEYSEYRIWLAAIAQAQADHEAYLEWRAHVEYREWRYQQYREWRAHVEYQEWRYQQYRAWRAYVEWREWLAYLEWRDNLVTF